MKRTDKRAAGDVDALERRLFRAARAYEPPGSVKRRVIGVVAAATGMATIGGAGAAAATGAATTTGAKAIGGAAVAAWILGVTAIGGVGYVATFALRGPGAEPSARVAVVASGPAPHVRRGRDDGAAVDTSPAAPTAREASTAELEPVASAPPAPPSPSSSAPPAAPVAPRAATTGSREDPSPVPAQPGAGPDAEAPTPAADELAAEIALLDAARRRLASGDAAGAIAALREREARHPRGKLGLEAQLVEIDALARSGRRDEARALAERFLARHGNHVLAPRVRKLAGLEPPP